MTKDATAPVNPNVSIEVDDVDAAYRAAVDAGVQIVHPLSDEVWGRHGFGVLVGGFDYRASPDWGSLLGYSRESLAEMQMRAIDFLRDLARPYEGQVPALLYAGIIGPRGDAYEVNRAITAEEAEEYHSEQLATLARAGVDLAEAMTFNSVPEAVGLARAAARAGLPLSVSFTLDNATRRLVSGPTLKDAIETIDAQTGDDRPTFYGINCSHPLEFMPAIEPGSGSSECGVCAPTPR